ncbi:MAG: serine hydrolase [Bacteroidota bacterium]
MRKNLVFIITLFGLWSCTNPEVDPLKEILANNESLQQVSSNPAHKVQILYTQIDRDEDNTPHFKTYAHNLDTSNYFYPASTVKLPTALLALERLNDLAIPGLNRNTTFLTGASTPPQSAVASDTTKADSLPTIEHYIKKILLVSDNDAYNRLFEFLGQGYINEKLKEKGFDKTRIIHRLSVGGFDTLGNRLSNPVQFLDGNEVVYELKERYSNGYPTDWGLANQTQGKAYMNSEGEIVEEPFLFHYKNYMSLQSLHDIVKAVIFPDQLPEDQRFNLSASDYDLVRKYMSTLPRESEEPAYPDLVDWDDYVKFLLYGSAKNKIPEYIKIFNKVGDAYGYLTDAAYIIDTKNKVEFLLAATIHVNANETFNDGVYEYDAIGFPFLGELGKKIYEYELERPRQHRPNFD